VSAGHELCSKREIMPGGILGGHSHCSEWNMPPGIFVARVKKLLLGGVQKGETHRPRPERGLCMAVHIACAVVYSTKGANLCDALCEASCQA